ncbi:MAG: patatin-like phospholipase family protein [Candidatus Omnitrophota bacterium]|nr:MAG: patatin-like phospholipase family protein [Candidatus Omnitrophota bacterium]
MKIGLALGGGGARGFFHIGVLKSFEKLKLKIDIIAGTSIGAIIGGLYSLYQDASYVEKVTVDVLGKYREAISFLKGYSSTSGIEEKRVFLENSFQYIEASSLWNLRIAKPYLIDPKPFIRVSRALFKNYRFSDCKIPFIVTGVDLIKSEAVFFQEGLLSKAVIVSCALPGFFPPVKRKNELLVDGGVLLHLPAEPLKEYADFIVGINVEHFRFTPSPIRDAVDVLFCADRVRWKNAIENTLKAADFLISAPTEGIFWGDFDKAKELIEQGEKTGLMYGEELLKALRRERIK